MVTKCFSLYLFSQLIPDDAVYTSVFVSSRRFCWYITLLSSCPISRTTWPRGFEKSVVSPDTFTEKIRNWGGRCAAPCAIEIHLKNNTLSINIERRTPLCVPSTWFFQVFRNNSRTRCLRSTRFPASASLSLSASFKTTFTAIHALDTIFRIF